MRFSVFLLVFVCFCSALDAQKATLVINSEWIAQEREKARVKRQYCDDWKYQTFVVLPDQSIVKIPSKKDLDDKKEFYKYDEFEVAKATLNSQLALAAYEYAAILNEHLRADFKYRYLKRDYQELVENWNEWYMLLRNWLKLPKTPLEQKHFGDNSKDVLDFIKSNTAEIELKVDKEDTDQLAALAALSAFANLIHDVSIAYNLMVAEKEATFQEREQSLQEFRRHLLIHEDIRNPNLIIRSLRVLLDQFPDYLAEHLEMQVFLCERSIQKMDEEERSK